MADEFSGTLNQRVAIEQWLAARDAAGADAGHWVAVASAWAAIVPDGNGADAGEARRSARRWRVVLRAGAPVGLTTRLIWQGQYLVVLAVDSDPRQPDRQLLRCEARVA
ncbi:MAG: hypothetical protein RL490_327 [Pseudomonadota bacterium]|jgi:head-tail adaptor